MSHLRHTGDAEGDGKPDSEMGMDSAGEGEVEAEVEVETNGEDAPEAEVLAAIEVEGGCKPALQSNNRSRTTPVGHARLPASVSLPH